ncbi:hypothetical protein Scep_010449 [Stephania cephalantha]|uniref:Secreted protein n=1 Tax=Stephania cephalantha TaxID=152367 RepID=A0AAP0PDB8_9MAGN
MKKVSMSEAAAMQAMMLMFWLGRHITLTQNANSCLKMPKRTLNYGYRHNAAYFIILDMVENGGIASGGERSVAVATNQLSFSIATAKSNSFISPRPRRHSRFAPVVVAAQSTVLRGTSVRLISCLNDSICVYFFTV